MPPKKISLKDTINESLGHMYDKNFEKFFKIKKGNFKKNHIIDISGSYYQADLVYMPYDELTKSKYILVLVNISNNRVYARDIIDRTSESCVSALKFLINKNKELKDMQILQTDNGSEFKDKFAKYCKENDIELIYMNPYNKGTMSIVERMIKTITHPLYKYMSIYTLKQKMTKKGAQQYNTDWVALLKKIIARINEYYEKLYHGHKYTLSDLFKQHVLLDKKILPIGSIVYVANRKPVHIINETKLYGTFRNGDQRFNEKEHKITNYLVKSGHPIRYFLDNDLTISYALKDLLEK